MTGNTIRVCRKLVSARYLPFLCTVVLLGCYLANLLNDSGYSVRHNVAKVDAKNASSYQSNLQARYFNNVILLALVDLGAYEMAVNFYETSLQKHGIKSYLLLASNKKVCVLLQPKGVNCYTYGFDPASEKRSAFGSSDFVNKMAIRTNMILEALELGYNVLVSDLDIIFVRNPFHSMPCLDGSCDAAILWDSTVYNAGFLYIKSSELTIALYRAVKTAIERTRVADQFALNYEIKRLKGKIKVSRLPVNSFLCGKAFYEDLHLQYGDDPLPKGVEPIVIHNNWIVSVEAKIYRFKEMLQWENDDFAYYSSESRTYLVYSNPTDALGEKSTAVWTREKEALENALMVASLLNRTLILPKFHCGIEYCSLLNHINLKAFDNVFGAMYRENLFLRHAKVPKKTSLSLSPVVEMVAENIDDTIQGSNFVEKQIYADRHKGPSEVEIIQFFRDSDSKVLQFSHLYGHFKQLRRLPFKSYGSFSNAFIKAFKPGNYRQMR